MRTRVLILMAVVLAGLSGIWVAGGWRSNSESKSSSGAPSRDTSRHSSPAPVSAPSSKEPATPAKSSGDLEARLAALEAAVTALQKSAASADSRRLAALEKSVKTLQEAMNGVSIEKASADRQALFAGEDGYVKANEYFEAGKYAIAAEGYVTFVQNHRDHPDAREVMKKARDAFLKAGFKDKAFWVQEEMLDAFPQHVAADVEELAVMEKNAGRYDRAVEHMARAAELAPGAEDRLWKRLYWAWYVQLRDGTPAGITALEQVQREIAASGVKNPKLVEHATTRMREWQQQLSRK